MLCSDTNALFDNYFDASFVFADWLDCQHTYSRGGANESSMYKKTGFRSCVVRVCMCCVRGLDVWVRSFATQQSEGARMIHEYWALMMLPTLLHFVVRNCSKVIADEIDTRKWTEMKYENSSDKIFGSFWRNFVGSTSVALVLECAQYNVTVAQGVPVYALHIHSRSSAHSISFSPIIFCFIRTYVAHAALGTRHFTRFFFVSVSAPLNQDMSSLVCRHT